MPGSRVAQGRITTLMAITRHRPPCPVVWNGYVWVRSCY